MISFSCVIAQVCMKVSEWIEDLLWKSFFQVCVCVSGWASSGRSFFPISYSLQSGSERPAPCHLKSAGWGEAGIFSAPLCKLSKSRAGFPFVQTSPRKNRGCFSNTKSSFDRKFTQKLLQTLKERIVFISTSAAKHPKGGLTSHCSHCCYLQEVTLIRSSAEERLGLTLCYEQDDIEESLTHIFIDDIHPDGLAARDQRLRLGDQIIQVSLIIRELD